MNRHRIGYTPCQDCGGTGTKPDEMPCTTCEGTGLVVVFDEPTVSHKPPVQSSKRRQFPRHHTDLRIKVRNQQGNNLVGRCVVIAEGGLGAILPHPISKGSEVTVQVSIPTQASVLEAQAIVRNQKGLRHGFRFVSLADAERLAIRQFCNQLMVQSDDGRVDS